MIKMLVIAVAPAIAILIYIYQQDRYDREPKALLLSLFLGGCIVTLPVYYIEKFLSFFNRSAFYQAFIVAGLTEELFKYFVIKKIGFYNINYDEKLDGIVYSVFTSLGFATVENILYVTGVGSSFLYTGISRAIFALPAHMLFAITMGYYLSQAKFAYRKRTSYFALSKSILIPIILHGIYDYILFLRKYGLFPIFILFVLFLWRINLNKLNQFVNESRDRAK